MLFHYRLSKVLCKAFYARIKGNKKPLATKVTRGKGFSCFLLWKWVRKQFNNNTRLLFCVVYLSRKNNALPLVSHDTAKKNNSAISFIIVQYPGNHDTETLITWNIINTNIPIAQTRYTMFLFFLFSVTSRKSSVFVKRKYELKASRQKKIAAQVQWILFEMFIGT